MSIMSNVLTISYRVNNFIVHTTAANRLTPGSLQYYIIAHGSKSEYTDTTPVVNCGKNYINQNDEYDD